MDEKNTPETNKSANPLFTQKKVETPLLDQPLRQRLDQSGASGTASSGGFKEFYRLNRFYFWAIGFGIVVIAILSFFALRKSPAVKVAEAKVSIDISAPDTVPSGADVIYKITVQNQDPKKLVGMTLEVTYPDGFSFVSSSPDPQNLSGTQFAVPDLISGQNATLFVKAKASGNLNDSKSMTATLHYKYSDFNSDFSKQQSFSVRLSASNVSLELSGPQTTNNAQLVVYTLTYKNNSENDIQSARITLTYPDGFQFASADPQPDISSNIWNIGTLPKGKDGTITLQGNFTNSSPGQSKTIGAALSVLGGGGEYFDQASTSFVTAISSLPLLVSQQLAAGNATQAVRPGDTLTYSIKYQNNAQTAAHGVNIVASLDSKAVNLSSIRAEGAQVSNNTITWNASSVAALEILRPSESGTVNFSVQVNNPATKDSASNMTVVSHIKIKADEYDTYFPGQDLTLKIFSPFSFSTGLTYVSGAMPPRVGTDTVYKVSLILKNSTNDYSNTVVTAFIPLGAGGFDQGSTNSEEAGTVTYDPSTGKLTWNVGTLAAHAGQFAPPRSLSFNVRLNPSSAQVGQSPVLIKNIQLVATDSFTTEAIKGSTPDITTDNLNGQNGYGNGLVTQ